MTKQHPGNRSAEGPDTREALPAPLGGTRAQAIQRLQIGLFGLAAMILLVALANIIMDRAKESEATTVPEAAPTSMPDSSDAEPASDPLVDAGVVPDLPVDTPEQGGGEPPRTGGANRPPAR